MKLLYKLIGYCIELFTVAISVNNSMAYLHIKIAPSFEEIPKKVLFYLFLINYFYSYLSASIGSSFAAFLAG
jgi:hypothetical protein